MSFQPGELMQEIFTDPKTGIRYDGTTGNPIADAGPQDYNPNAVAYYTSSGQPLKYAAVYPGPTNVHINKALTDLSVSFEIDTKKFIAPEISPIRTVDKRSDSYFKIARDDVARDYGNKLQRAIGTTANEITQAFDTDTYNAVDYAVRDFVPDKVASNADQALQLMQSTTTFLTSVVDLGWDRRIVSKMFGAANLTNTTFSAATVGGAGTINTATNTARYINQAFNTVRTNVAIANNGAIPTHVAFSMDVAQRIAASVEIADQVKFGMGVEYVVNGGWQGKNYGLPNELYGMKVVVGSQVTNIAARGQAFNGSLLMSNTIGFFVVEQPGLKTRNTNTTFRVGGLNVRSYRDEARKGTWVEVEMDQDEKFTNAFGGYLLTGA